MGFKTDTYIIKGMKQDLSDAVFDKSFAFENMNIRIFARQNNSTFSVEQEMGNTKIDKINLYDDLKYTQLNSVLTEIPFTVIGTCVIDNYIILFGVDSVNSTIARLELQNNTWNMVYLYQGNLLGFDKNHPIETLPNIETDSVKKVYFVDGLHQPRAINVLKQYTATNISDITLGTHLKLEETFTVTKDWNHAGQYPGGKVQFGFTYLNVNGSETNLVELSPMFDCTRTNEGISNNAAESATGNYTYSEHSFNVEIQNLDDQFEFIRIYVFMTTSAGATTIKYVERHLDSYDRYSEVIDYDEADLTDFNGNFADLNAREVNIIPYTMATKDNFMFYGNVKESFPDLSSFSFDESDFQSKFSLKEIGYEEYIGNTMYHYTPRLTSFSGSNFEYMGFRKSNWYRFGIIVQHESGRWSDVIFLCDRQCDKDSCTKIEYSPNNIPLRSKYFIPRFELIFTPSGFSKLDTLFRMGFKKIKPVCVVPPPKYRNVLSQGIVAPTMYRGEDRIDNNLGSNTFCFPSYFYRPKPLSSPLLHDSVRNVFSAEYTYTIRDIKDQTIFGNYTDGGVEALTNPTFTRPTDVINLNSPYREYRHGFSLPPKDTLNAECEFSAIGWNEYCFMDTNGTTVLDFFSNVDHRSVPMGSSAQCPENVWANGYNDSVFIDESVCTFNSPEVDLNDMFVTGVRNYVSVGDIRIKGYAQITGGGNRIRVARTTPVGDYSTYANKYMPQAQCLFSLSDNNDLDVIYDVVGRRYGLKQQPLPYFSGPFYFSPIKVLGFYGRNGSYDKKGYKDGIYYDGITGHNDFLTFSKTYDRYNDPLRCDWSFFGEFRDHGNSTFNVDGDRLTITNNVDTNLTCVAVDFSGSASSQSFLHNSSYAESAKWLILQQLGVTNFLLGHHEVSGENFIFKYNTQLVFPDDFELSSTVWYSDYPYFKWLYITDDYATIGTNEHTNNKSFNLQLGNYFFYPFIANKNTYLGHYNGPIISHPMLLPIKDTSGLFQEFFIEHTGMNPQNMIVGQYATYCFNGNKYGCHYYMPFSTEFFHSAFEPWYLCNVYPFMHIDTSVPIIGGIGAYNDDDMYNRPEYNNTSTLLYSTVTNYFNEVPFNRAGTSQAYYSQDEQVAVNFTDLEWLSIGNGNLTLRYDYKIGLQESNLLFQYKTTPLIAAMKWYRGFKSLTTTDTLHLFSNGVILSTESYLGNTVFSGMLPQLFTKCGYLPTKYFDQGNSDISYISRSNITDANDMISDMKDMHKEINQLHCSFDFMTYPHIVFTSTNGRQELLPEFTYTPSQHEKPFVPELNYNSNVTFNPHFYYKTFVKFDEFDGHPTYDHMDVIFTARNAYVGAARGPYTSIYPHTGYWYNKEFTSKSDGTGLSYWQYHYNQQNPSRPFTIDTPTRRSSIEIDRNPDYLSMYDEDGKKRNIDNYWLLQIANLYNKRLETDYQLSQYGNNPYTYEGLSVSYWTWMPCGYSLQINDILNGTTSTSSLVFDEGDTYFQRYNSIKSYKRPLTANFKNDISDVASVMIESYINLDGHTWDHTELRAYDSNVFFFPEANTQAQINPVYTLNDSYMTPYHMVDYNYPTEDHYPTRIMWSARKTNGEYTDSWGIVPASNYYDTLGTCGDVTKLVSYNDNVFCLQQHGFSVLDFNSKSLIQSSTGNPISVYFQEGLRLQNNSYLSREVGTLNKWSVAVGRGGIYWMDETLKSFYKFPGSNSNVPVDLSLSAGFKAWSNNNIFENNSIWNVNKFNPGSKDNSYKANYDLRNNDIYWANANHCICYNELIDGFTSFFSYNRIPYIFNYRDSVYSLFQDITSTKLYHQFSNYKHQLYGASMISYVELLVNPDPLYDKIFNFIEYDAECFSISSPNRESLLQRIPNLNPYNKLFVHNSYQNGSLSMDSRNTSERFRVWRTDLPREAGTMNRIRSPWCRIRLENEPDVTVRNNEYRDQLHYISVNYTLPEQPPKTNLR